MTYDTSDITLAGTLLCYNFQLAGIDKTNSKKVVFRFEPLGNEFSIMQVVDLYFTKKAIIEPSYFMAQIRFLKSQIHAN